MITDAHVHTGGYAHISTKAVLHLADSAGFDKVFCTDITALHYDTFEGNRLLAEDMKRYPDRIIGYCSITSARFGKKAVGR
jgi:hypothetical protein